MAKRSKRVKAGKTARRKATAGVRKAGRASARKFKGTKGKRKGK